MIPLQGDSYLDFHKPWSPEWCEAIGMTTKAHKGRMKNLKDGASAIKELVKSIGGK